MIPALLLAALAGTVASPGEPLSAGTRLEAVRAGYQRLEVVLRQPRVLGPQTKAALEVRFQSARENVEALASAPNEARLSDLERTEELDRRIVPELLRGIGDPVEATPGAHIGLARAGDAPVPFAYWVPAGYDPRRPAPLVVLLHGKGEPESDVIARRFLRELADATGTVLLAPGGDDRDGDAMAAGMEAAEAALSPALALDAKRRYLGGVSGGVAGAFHAVARAAVPPAGFLGIGGMLDDADAAAVERRMRGKGVYVVNGGRDAMFGTAPVRAYVRALRAAGVQARYYEVPGAVHGLGTNATGVARAWHDMLDGVVTVTDDDVGP
jgi:predicted esterase